MHKDGLPLHGRTAVVTGAARGLGRSFALHLADLGARVAVLDLDLAAHAAFDYEAGQYDGLPTAAILDRRASAPDQRALAYEVDVTDPAALTRVAGGVAAAWGTVDVLVCNAGGGVGTMTSSAASRLDPEAAELTVRRNLLGTINTVVAFAPHLARNGNGRVITLSSHAGLLPAADGGYAHYAAAKAGVILYTQALAQDLGPQGISVNCIAPGNIRTGRIQGLLDPEQERRAREATALGRLGTEQDCAAVVGFLASDAAQFVTGTVIPVDGGTLRRAAVG